MATWKKLKQVLSFWILKGLYRIADDLEKERMRDDFPAVRLPRSMPRTGNRERWHYRN